LASEVMFMQAAAVALQLHVSLQRLLLLVCLLLLVKVLAPLPHAQQQ
jgi:hypothetical protein